MTDLETFLTNVKQKLSAEGTVHLRVKVTPGAPKTEIVDVLEAEEPLLKTKVTAAPERGRANAAVEKLLGKTFGGTANIVSGYTTGLKLIQLKQKN